MSDPVAAVLVGYCVALSWSIARYLLVERHTPQREDDDT